METLTQDDIRRVLDDYKNATNNAMRSESERRALEILDGFVNDRVDVSPDGLDAFSELLKQFGTQQNADGTTVLTELGARATAKYEGIISALANQLGNVEPNRIYSMLSDDNQIKFDQVSLGVLQQMGLVDANLNVADMTPAAVWRSISSVDMTDAQRVEYAGRFVDAVITDPDLFECVPPAILADAYAMTRDVVRSERDDARREQYVKRFETLATRIDYLINNFSSMAGYYYADPSNIAGVYAGYTKMLDVRAPDVRVTQRQNERTRNYNQAQAAAIESTRERLNQLIAEYDELYNLTNLHPENAEELKTRWGQLKSKLADTEINDETLAVAGGYRFLDASGNPMPQFLDASGNPVLDFVPGCTLNPDGRLARVLSLARNDVAMRNVGDLATPVDDMDTAAMLDSAVPWKFAEISIPDQVASGITQAPEKFQDDKYVEQFWDDVKTSGGQISDRGYQAALDAQVNSIAGFAGELGRHIGNDQAVVMMPFQVVEDIDRLAETRSEKQGAVGRGKKIGFFKRMAKNFGMAATMSAGLTFIGKATGVAYVGAAIGTTLGVGNMAYQGLKWRNEQKRQGKPHSIKDFLRDKRNWGPAVASGMGVAAVISMATGNPEFATAFGLAAVGVGGGASATMTYQDAVRAGYSRGAALGGAIGVMAAGILGGIAGNAAMNGLVNYVNNNTDSTLFKHESNIDAVRTETQRVYSDGVIENNERILRMWESPDQLSARIDGLTQAGLSHDDAVRYLLAFHDATDHNLGGGYFHSIGMSDSALSALRNSISGTDVNLTPESIAAFEHFNPHISATNTVGYVAGAPVRYDLPANAAYDTNGQLVPGNDLYSTYVMHDGPIFSDVLIDVPVADGQSVFTPNELAFPAGIGTFGIYEPRVVGNEYHSALRDRAGALADRVARVAPDAGLRSLPDGPTLEHTDNDADQNGNKNTDVTTDVDNNHDTETPTPDTPDTPDVPDTPDTPDAPDGTDEPSETKNKKRGFFGWAKDTTYDIMRATKNGLVKVVHGMGEILDAGGQVHSKLLDRKREVNEKQYILNKEKQMAKLDEIKQKNAQNLEKIRGELNIEAAHLSAEQRAAMKKLRAEIKQAQLKNQNSKDLRAAKQLEIDISRIEAEWKKEEKRLRGQAARAGIKGYFDTTNADVENQKRKNERNLLKQQGRNDVTAEQVGIAHNVGRRIRAFFTGMARIENFEVESAQNAIELARAQAKKAKTDYDKQLWQAATAKIQLMMKETSASPEQQAKLAQKIIDKAVKELGK